MSSIVFQTDMNKYPVEEHPSIFQELYLDYHGLVYQEVQGVETGSYFADYPHYAMTMASQNLNIPPEYVQRNEPVPPQLADPENGIVGHPGYPANIGGRPFPTGPLPTHTSMFNNLAQTPGRADEVKIAVETRKGLDQLNGSLKTALQNALPINFISRMKKAKPSPGNPPYGMLTAKQLLLKAKAEFAITTFEHVNAATETIFAPFTDTELVNAEELSAATEKRETIATSRPKTAPKL